MVALVVLLILVAVGVAVLLGFGADTRDSEFGLGRLIETHPRDESAAPDRAAGTSKEQ